MLLMAVKPLQVSGILQDVCLHPFSQKYDHTDGVVVSYLIRASWTKTPELQAEGSNMRSCTFSCSDFSSSTLAQENRVEECGLKDKA